jgi:ATP synthase protein I
MQAIDARLLRGAAVPTAVAGAIAVVLCSVLVGLKGFTGALIGSVIVLAFFSATILIISRVAQKQPELLLGYAMLTYLGKILVLAVLMIAFKHTTLFHFRAFGFTMLALTLVWLAAETRAVLKTKILYVDPDAIGVSKPAPAPVSKAESTAESEPTYAELSSKSAQRGGR